MSTARISAACAAVMPTRVDGRRGSQLVWRGLLILTTKDSVNLRLGQMLVGLGGCDHQFGHEFQISQQFGLLEVEVELIWHHGIGPWRCGAAPRSRRARGRHTCALPIDARLSVVDAPRH